MKKSKSLRPGLKNSVNKKMPTSKEKDMFVKSLLQTSSQHSQAGFMLIEAVIAIMVLSIATMPVLQYLEIVKNQKDTEKKVKIKDRTVSALVRYVRKNGHYPCPADPALAPDDKNFGKKDCSGGGKVLIGALPTYELDLPFQASVNQYDAKNIYAVTRKLTNASTFDGTGEITVKEEGTDLATPADDSGAQFLIVNPGPDGKGTRSLSGANSSIAGFGNCASGGDSENCDGDSVFANKVFSKRNNPLDPDHYDDAVYFQQSAAKNTFWAMRETSSLGSGDGGNVDIFNRNIGFIGIGEMPDDPAEGTMLYVNEGDVSISGDVSASQHLIIENDINEKVNDVKSKDSIESGSYEIR